MTYEVVIYVRNQITVYVDADDIEQAEEMIESRLSQGEYDDMIAESVGNYTETHDLDITEC